MVDNTLYEYKKPPSLAPMTGMYDSMLVTYGFIEASLSNGQVVFKEILNRYSGSLGNMIIVDKDHLQVASRKQVERLVDKLSGRADQCRQTMQHWTDLVDQVSESL